ncbi:MAG TPA: hypothetical protein DCZ51_06165 [Bacteroidales bacterium]|nr:hypothetical protein [Bacteroidales bacterium]
MSSKTEVRRPKTEGRRIMKPESRYRTRPPAPSPQLPAPRNQQLSTWYLLAALFLMEFAYFFLYGSHILFFQEQQHLFIYRSSFINDFFLKPGGLLDLSGKFLTQFYISKLAGSVILAAVLTLPAIILQSISKRLLTDSALSNLLVIIPSCILLLMQTHYYNLLMYDLGFLLVLAYFLISIFPEKKTWRYITLAFFPLFYYLVGAYALIFIGLYVIYCLFYIKSPGKYLYPLFLLASAGISILLFNRIFLLQSVKQLFLYPLPFINDSMHQRLFYFLAGFMILYPALCKLAGSVNLKRLNKSIITIIPGAIALCLTIVLLKTGYNSQTARVINLESLVFQGKWNEAIQYHERYPSENMIGQYFYNIALSESGQLCERLFHGKQDFGTASLFLPWSSEHINWGAHSFYAIGLINEAQRWAYEEMVVYGPRPQNMKLLVKSSLINGKYALSEKYTGILRNTLFYNSWAKKYEKMIGDTSAIHSDNDLGKKIKLIPQSDFFIFLDSPEQNLPVLVDETPPNREAFEYLMSWLLLSKEVDILVNNIRLMKKIGYTRIPEHIEEAIMIYYNSQGTFPDLGGLSISNGTVLRFEQYFGAYMKARQNPGTMKEKMQKQFGNTFWYYFHFK